MPEKHSITILGSGPSGLTAAINLAQAGYEVHVYERNRDVGQRFQGDLQGLENWSKKEDVLGDLSAKSLKINFDCDPFTKLDITNGTWTEQLTFKKPLFYLIKRGSVPGSLDQGLKKQAVAAGVQFHFSTTVTEDQADIIATGPILKEIVGIVKGIVFKTKLPDLAIALANDQAAYRGYAYLLVTKGYGCMCTVLVDRLTQVNSCWERTQEIFSQLVELDVQDPHGVGGVGCFAKNHLWQRGRRFYVGEAAGLQDLLWGFGIRTSIISGWLAAQCIIEKRNYPKEARALFSRRTQAGIVNRFLWEKFGNRNYRVVVSRLSSEPDPFQLLSSFYNFNILQRLIYPFALSAMKRRYHNVRF